MVEFDHANAPPAMVAGNPTGTPLRMQLVPGGPEHDVWPILANAEGDIPIMEKLTNSIGHAGLHACYRCALNAETIREARCARCGPWRAIALGTWQQVAVW